MNPPSRRATKRQSPLRMRIEAAMAAVLLFVARYLPHVVAAAMASGLARLLCVADARHRRIMMRQMRLAFGDRFSARDRMRLSRACYRHEILCLLELARLPRVDDAYIRRHVDTSEMDACRELKASGQGALVITGHIGSWELLARAAAVCGYEITALARPLKNPYLNAILHRLRTGAGTQIREKRDSLRSISRLLRAGRWVCFLYDQNGGPRDAFVPFFGVPAATWRSAPFLHLKFGVPIIVVTLTRENWTGTRFKARVHANIPAEQSRSAQDPEYHALRAIHAGFEEAITAHPEQWLWQHRRWKTRPQGEDAKNEDGVPAR